MVYIWLLCTIVFGAELSARQEGRLTLKAGGPVEDFQDLRAKRGQIEADGAKGYQRIKMDASRAVNGQHQELGMLAGKAERNLDNLDNAVKTFKDSTSSDHQELMKESTKGMRLMNKGSIKVNQLGQQMEKLLDDTTLEQTQEQNDESSQSANDFAEQFKSAKDDIRTKMDSEKDELAEGQEHVSEKFATVGDDIRSTQEADTEGNEELMDLAKEVQGVNREMNSAIQSVGRENVKEGTRAKREAIKAKDEITLQADKDNMQGRHSVEEVSQAASKEISEMQKNHQLEAEAIQDENNDKADDLGLTISETVKDTAKEVSEMRQEDHSLALDDTKAQAEGEEELAIENGLTKDLANTGNNLEEDAEEQLTEKVDEANVGVSTLQSDIETAGTTDALNLVQQTRDLKSRVRDDLYAQTTYVKGAVNTDVQELDATVHTGSDHIEHAIDSLRGSAGHLGAEMESDSHQLQSMSKELDDTSRALHQASQDVAGGSEDTKQHTFQALNEEGDLVKDKFAKASAQLKKEAEMASNATAKLQGVATRDLLGKVEAVKTEADKRLDASGLAIKSATTRSSDVLVNMDAAVESIGNLQAEVEEKLPVAKDDAAKQLYDMQNVVSESKKTLRNEKDIMHNKIQVESIDAAEKIGKTIGEASTSLNSHLLDSAGTIMSQMESVGANVGDMQQAAAQDYATGVAFQTKVKRQVWNSISQVKRAEELARSQDAEMKERLRIAESTVDAGIKRQPETGEQLWNAVVSKLTRERHDAQAAADKQIQNAMHTGTAEINGFEQRAVNALGEDLTKVNGYMADNEAQFGTLKGSVGTLDSGLESAVHAARASEAFARAQVANNEQKMKAIEAKMLTATADEKKMLAAQKEQLAAQQQKLILQIEKDEQKLLAKMDSATQKKFLAEKAKEKAMRESEMAAVEEVNRKLKGEADDVAGQVRSTEARIKSLEHNEMTLQQKLQNGAGAIDSAVSLGEDAVKRREEGEESHLASVQDKDLGMIEGLMNKFRHTKDRAGTELQDLDEEFQKKLNALKGAGGEEAKKLRAEIADLLHTSPDFAALFTQDTTPARIEIKSAHGRIDAADAWAKQITLGLEEQLKKVQSTRNDEAYAIHARASDTRRKVVDDTEKSLEHLTGIQNVAKDAKYGLEKDIENYSKKLAALGLTTSKQDSQTFEHMDNQLFNLMSAHGRLMEWKKHFTERTGSWHDQVDSQLRKLTANLASDDTQNSDERLQDEVNRNEGARQMQLRVENEIADGSKDRTQAFSKLADEMRVGAEAVANDEADNRAKLAEAEAGARAAIGDNTIELSSTLSNVAQQQDTLSAKTDELNHSINLANANFDSKFKLPSATVNGANVDTNGDIEALHSKMGAMSLEETHVKLSSSDEMQEMRALMSLNEELSSENAKIAKSNTKLLSGLKVAKEKKDHKK